MRGQCLCGSVTYSTEVQPSFQLLCHCRDCQKSTGSAYAPIAFFPEENLQIAGEVKYFESLGRSGKRIWRGFCPNCGSNLFGRLEKFPDMLSIRAGTLDDPSQFGPKLHIFAAEAPSWDLFDTNLKAFEQDVPPKSAA